MFPILRTIITISSRYFSGKVFPSAGDRFGLPKFVALENHFEIKCV